MLHVLGSRSGGAGAFVKVDHTGDTDGCILKGCDTAWNVRKADADSLLRGE